MNKHEKLKIISSSIFLEEDKPWSSLFIILATTVTLFLLFLIWSIFAEVNETAVAFGQVEPKNKVEIIEHAEGGIVKEVFVRNGQQVKKGEKILEMNLSQSDAELKQLLTRKTNLNLDLLRLSALKNDEQISESLWEKTLDENINLPPEKASKLLTEKIETFNQQKENHLQKIATLQQQLVQYNTDIEKYSKQIEIIKENYDLYKQELKMFASSIKLHYVSMRDYIAIKRRTNETKEKYVSLQTTLKHAQSQAKEQKEKIKQVISQFRDDLQQQINSIQSQLSELQHLLKPLEEAVKRQTITAPIDGIIDDLNEKPNSVIASGEKVLSLIPTTSNIIVNARLNTKDIGYINLNDKANIKILTYDYTKYGVVPGKIVYISANTKFNEKNTPYYEVHIQPESNFVNNDKNLPIKTGMTAEVDIITGRKSILDYIISPIKSGATEALRER